MPFLSFKIVISFLLEAFEKSKEISPVDIPSFWSFFRSLILSAELRRVFVGMHPLLRQVPPVRSFSMIKVFAPSWAALIAAVYPPGPEPIIAISNMDISHKKCANALHFTLNLFFLILYFFKK